MNNDAKARMDKSAKFFKELRELLQKDAEQAISVIEQTDRLFYLSFNSIDLKPRVKITGHGY